MAVPTISFTYNTVAKVLSLVSDGTLSADYYLDDSSNNLRFRARVAHTDPGVGNPGESHMIRLDVESLDSTTKALIRKTSVWTSTRTDVSTQDTAVSQYAWEALVDFSSDAKIGQVLSRISDLSA